MTSTATTKNQNQNHSRPTTPVLLETTNLYLHDLETPPCTPPHRAMPPLSFDDCPPAPRPRKRIFQVPDSIDEMADLFLPTSTQMDEGVSFLAPQSPLPHFNPTMMMSTHLKARPTTPRRVVARRSIRRSIRPLPVPVFPTDTDASDADAQNENDPTTPTPSENHKVRISFRRSFNVADLGKMGDLSKLWSTTPPTPAAKVTLKRRNSYNALCA